VQLRRHAVQLHVCAGQRGLRVGQLGLALQRAVLREAVQRLEARDAALAARQQRLSLLQRPLQRRQLLALRALQRPDLRARPSAARTPGISGR